MPVDVISSRRRRGRLGELSGSITAITGDSVTFLCFLELTRMQNQRPSSRSSRVHSECLHRTPHINVYMTVSYSRHTLRSGRKYYSRA